MSVKRRVTRFGNYDNNVVTRFDWANNVVYNWGTQTTYSNNATGLWDDVNRVGSSSSPTGDGEFVQLNFMNNYFIAGPCSISNLDIAYEPISATNHELWQSGNLMDSDQDAVRDGTDNGWDIVSGSYDQKTQAFVINSPLDIALVNDAYNNVIVDAGASFVRDDVDNRVLNELVTGGGQIIEEQTEVGGWPTIAEVNRPAGFDTDGDGMPNLWEYPRGLDAADANDGAYDADSDGYTNLEEYLNFLAFRGGESVGDFDKDGQTDWLDLFEIGENWLREDCNGIIIGNLNYDCDVDFEDFAIFSQDWD